MKITAITITLKRTVQTEPYQSAGASYSVTADLDDDDKLEEVQTTARRMAALGLAQALLQARQTGGED